MDIKGVYWGYNPLTNHLLTSWDIQVHPWDDPPSRKPQDTGSKDVDVNLESEDVAVLGVWSS